MYFFLSDLKVTKEITLRGWNEAENNWTPDVFGDWEESFPRSHNETRGYAVVCTSQEYGELIAWWEAEIEAMNNKQTGQNGTDYTADDGCEDLEYCLFYN